MSKVFDFMDEQRAEFLKTKHEEAKRFIDPETGKIGAEFSSYIDCPVCSSRDYTYAFSKNGFDFVKCRHCTLLHVNPQLKGEVQDSIYKSSRTAEQWIAVQQNKKEQAWNTSNKFMPALEQLNALRSEKGRLLDVGCSIGQFLNLAEQDGWQVEGVELNAEASKVAQEEYGLTVHNSKLEDIGFEEQSFDVITLWGIFEHLTDPNFMLQTVRGLLKPGGLVLFFVPNGNGLVIRMTRDNNSTVSGRAHLWYFTPNTMTKILENNGFEKADEFSVLPQIHEIEHFLQYNTLYQEPQTACEEEFTIPDEIRSVLTDYMNEHKLGYKLITIGRRVD